MAVLLLGLFEVRGFILWGSRLWCDVMAIFSRLLPTLLFSIWSFGMNALHEKMFIEEKPEVGTSPFKIRIVVGYVISAFDMTRGLGLATGLYSSSTQNEHVNLLPE